MKIIVNDANILIDLVKLDLLDLFFKLPFEFQTTTLILEELNPDQTEKLYPFIIEKQLHIEEFSETEMIDINILATKNRRLSLQDCSAFFLAMKVGAALITGDNYLRKYSTGQKVEIHGHLWILDKLYEENLLNGTEVQAALHRLGNEINPRLGLPMDECDKRMQKWSGKC